MEGKANQAIAKLLSALQRVPFLSIDRIAKGGSLGRRTLVAGSFDVDLLIFINLEYPRGWTSEAKLKLLTKVRDWLRRHDYPAVVEEEGTQYDDVLQVLVGGVEVDVLLVPNMTTGTTGDKTDLQREALMLPVYDNPYAHGRDQVREAAVAESHTAFLADCPVGVKAVIRLMKAWYKYGLKDAGSASATAAAAAARGAGAVRPVKVPSVALELVVLAAYQREVAPPQTHDQGLTGSDNASASFTLLHIFKTALRLLVRAVMEEAVITVNAGHRGCSERIALQYQHVWGGDPVRIIHPIDPTCNVARPRKRNPDWRWLGGEARSLLAALEAGSLEQLLNGSTLGVALRRLAEVKGVRVPWDDKACSRLPPVGSGARGRPARTCRRLFYVTVCVVVAVVVGYLLALDV